MKERKVVIKLLGTPSGYHKEYDDVISYAKPPSCSPPRLSIFMQTKKSK
jgi:hypothetical protein